MKLTHEEQVAIAKKILKAYHIHPSVSTAFREGSKNHRLFYSENCGKAFPAILYFLSNNPEWEAMVKEFADEMGVLPFHAILSHTDFGDLLDVLYVPADSEDMESFAEMAKQGLFVSHCYNLTEGFAEGGTIRVIPVMGGLLRVE